ncbi:transcriptional regulator [Pseudomonas sp.]|uniref:transcriptional regulator n=1 Tax=Pseudomonas sp. TaxID=306 RepID=UPI003FD84D52
MRLAKFVEQLPRGGKKLFAIKLGVTASYLSRLVSGDRSITAERAIQIEDATEGVITRFDLRPDIQWIHPKRPKKTAAQRASTVEQKIPVQRHHQQAVNSTVRPSSTALASP